MNAIISFKTDGIICPNVLESIQTASKMWGCDFILITERLQSEEFHDMFTKLYLPNRVQKYNRCLYLDTDILIKNDSPNPFELYPNPNLFLVVKDLQQDFLSEDIKENFKNDYLCGPYVEECRRITKIDLDYDFFKSNFFNAGMFMFSPLHHLDIFTKITNVLKDVDPRYKKIHQFEQSLLNYVCLSFLKDRLTFIPREWNYIDPPIDSDKMEGYIYHFTGWHYTKYKQILPHYDLWKK